MPINLAKGQKIELKKEAGIGLSRIVMGLGWDQKKAKGFLSLFSAPKDIDLDASCLLFDEAKNLVDTVWFRQLRSADGSIKHTGDNLTGAGEGDDEQIKINLASLPAKVKQLMFTINSFSGQTFEAIDNAYCRIVNEEDGKELARYNLSSGGRYTAQIMAKLYLENDEWQMQAIGEPANGRTFHDMMDVLKNQL